MHEIRRKNRIALLAGALVAAALFAANAVAQDETPASGAPWWLSPHRLLQTNLREIDATMDIDRYIDEVEAFGADVVLFNVGGIVANYPSELEYEYVNPNMQGDMTRTVVDRLHAEGIRVIGRFDFSKINETFAAEHPEWLYVSEDGQTVNYNGQVHTCVCGGYQQQYMFKILGEALDRYPLDGVFFNMIGFRRSDYSGNYHGLCQCENCRRRFREYSGLELPETAKPGDPAYAKYQEFTNWMRDRQFTRVNEFLKGKRPDLCICTYTSTGVDVIRKESNRALGRGTYHDTDKAKWTLATCGERQLANAAVHFIAIPYRHAAVSPQLTTRRLWQHLVNGAWLDFYCIGPLQRQEDRTGLDEAAAVFNFAKDNDRYFANTQPAGEVALVRRGGDEYEGLLHILCENHVPFELIPLDGRLMRRFPEVIIPDGASLSAEETKAVDAYVAAGGCALLTSGVPESLACLEKPKLVKKHTIRQGGYIRIRPEEKNAFAGPPLSQLDLVFLRGTFYEYETTPDVTRLLRLIPPDMFGPPEKCYYRTVSDAPGFISDCYEKGVVGAFTFDIGRHYYEQAHAGHAALVMAAVDHSIDRRVQVDTTPLVEINHRAGADGRFEWVSLYNHSGQRGAAIHPPIPVRDIAIRFMPDQEIRTVRSLQAGELLAFTRDAEGRIHVTLPELDRYDVVVFE